MSRATDIAWAGGLFEGEGCIALLRFTRRTGLALIVTSTDVDVLERFQEIVGCGSITAKAQRNRRPHHKQVYEWRIAGRCDVDRVANLLWPHLGERRTATLVDAMCERSDPVEMGRDERGRLVRA